MTQHALDIWRTMTAVLVFIGLVLLVRNRIKYRGFYNAQERSSQRAKFFLGLAPLVGLTWNVLKQASFNLGLPFVTLGAIALISSALSKPERMPSEPD